MNVSSGNCRALMCPHMALVRSEVKFESAEKDMIFLSMMSAAQRVGIICCGRCGLKLCVADAKDNAPIECQKTGFLVSSRAKSNLTHLVILGHVFLKGVRHKAFEFFLAHMPSIYASREFNFFVVIQFLVHRFTPLFLRLSWILCIAL